MGGRQLKLHARARYGVETVDDEFATQAPPSGDEDEVVAAGDVPRDAHEILGVAHDAPDAVAKGAYRELLRERHPDHGGSTAELRELNRAEALVDE